MPQATRKVNHSESIPGTVWKCKPQDGRPKMPDSSRPVQAVVRYTHQPDQAKQFLIQHALDLCSYQDGIWKRRSPDRQAWHPVEDFPFFWEVIAWQELPATYIGILQNEIPKT